MGDTLSHEQVFWFLSAVTVLLLFARFLGEVASRLGQPSVLGEILAGILLGPTVFGALAPELSQSLFPTSGPNSIVLNALGTFAVVLFLLVAGLEVDLSKMLRVGKQSIIIGLSALMVPLFIGFSLGWFAPNFVGADADAHPLIFALFFGTAIAISALPVVAKTLMDLKLFKTDFGMTVISSAIFIDLVGWMIFAVILSFMASGEVNAGTVGTTVFQVLLFVGLTLTVLRWLINKTIPYIQAYTTWPGGILGFIIVLGLVGAMITEGLGVHAIFGAFMVGIALGDSKHLRQHTRTMLEQFIGFIFAPLFFATIGLKVNFVANFDLKLTLIVTTVGCVGMLLGAGSAARLSGFSKKESLSIGFALNARGAMEIILGLLALEYGIISQRLFVSLVFMALFTSIICGPFIRFILKLKTGSKFSDFLEASGFLPQLPRTNRDGMIETLSKAASNLCDIPEEEIVAAVKKREESMSTALPNGVAIPHARFSNLQKPIVIVGLSSSGIDFDSEDGKSSKLVTLVLTPEKKGEQQLEILSNIAETFQDPSVVSNALETKNITEFLAVIKVAQAQEH